MLPMAGDAVDAEGELDDSRSNMILTLAGESVNLTSLEATSIETSMQENAVWAD